MKKLIIIFAIIMLCGVARAEGSSVSHSDTSTDIIISARDALKMAATMIDAGDIDTAEQMLVKMPNMGGGPLEIERWFLLGRISALRGDFNAAIKIYRTILNAQPTLALIRFELAVCYMQTKQWYRADYQLRLAMAGDNLPENVRQMMNHYRYVIRQNKNWNVWFNFGAAPDNNVNNATGGTECVITPFGPLCRNLTQPESAVGYNMTLGGDYEIQLSEQWRWKSQGGIYLNIYNNHNYDDLYLNMGTGPRYIWSRGDVWLAGTVARRWYGWNGYYWSAGPQLSTNYDFTRRISGGITLQYLHNWYDFYGEYLNGDTYSANAHIFYSITSNIYTIIRGGLAREYTMSKTYSYWQPNISIGIGAELPYGFNIYAEPSFYWQNYDVPQWSVQDGEFTQITERDFTQRYALSISNNKFSFMGFVPTLVFSYTRRDSNMWQREYDKYSIAFTLQQRF